MRCMGVHKQGFFSKVLILMVIPYLFIACLLLAFSSTVKGFDVDGIKSGMNQREVKSVVSKWKFPHLVEDRSHMHVDGVGDGRFYSFEFCDGKLVEITKGVKPSMKTFIATFKEMSDRYGRPIESNADRLAETDGSEHYVLDFLWRVGKEFVMINYSVFPTNEGMHTAYVIPNKCSSQQTRYKKYFYSPN
jgi:hypothetical protein